MPTPNASPPSRRRVAIVDAEVWVTLSDAERALFLPSGMAWTQQGSRLFLYFVPEDYKGNQELEDLLATAAARHGVPMKFEDAQ